MFSSPWTMSWCWATLGPDLALGIGLITGFLVGFSVGSYRYQHCPKGRDVVDNVNVNSSPDVLDASLQILDGALNLFRARWIPSTRSSGDTDYINGMNSIDNSTSKVVEYLKPEVMLQRFFHNDLNNEHPSFSLKYSIKKEPIQQQRNKDAATSPTSDTSFIQSPQSMLQLFSTILKYSVDTSHPYFFNQLFGATDPVALASELIALCVNTSVYTYETAPVFTLIEREVISTIAQIVYGSNDDKNNSTPATNYDGLMMPGGALSNLSALHVARQRYLSNNPYYNINYSNMASSSGSSNCNYDRDITICEGLPYGEEKKNSCCCDSCEQRTSLSSHQSLSHPQLVAFVSEEAHYSFLKAASVTGIGKDNLISIPTLSNGVMDVDCLHSAIQDSIACGKVPFFVGATSGSTVRGSFDAIDDIVTVCENFNNNSLNQMGNSRNCSIWIHVDGAWGGPALFSDKTHVKNLMRGVDQVDSFTFNPHKMLGAPQQTTVFVSRHKDILKSSNSSHAKYLFDERKHGAQYDLGDAAYTCGRRTDSVKIWAMLKFYGVYGLGKQVDSKVDCLDHFVNRVRSHDSFMLACEPWPFNVNFFFLPRRIRLMMKTHDKDAIVGKGDNPILPDKISNELKKVTVKLKLLMHEGGEMLIPYQPLSNQRADCFRLVLAGQKEFKMSDIDHIISIMERYGEDL